MNSSNRVNYSVYCQRHICSKKCYVTPTDVWEIKHPAFTICASQTRIMLPVSHCTTTFCSLSSFKQQHCQRQHSTDATNGTAPSGASHLLWRTPCPMVTPALPPSQIGGGEAGQAAEGIWSIGHWAAVITASPQRPAEQQGVEVVWAAQGSTKRAQPFEASIG